MSPLFAVLLGTLLVLLGCGSESDADRADDGSYSTPRPLASDILDEFDK